VSIRKESDQVTHDDNQQPGHNSKSVAGAKSYLLHPQSNFVATRIVSKLRRTWAPVESFSFTVTANSLSEILIVCND
jgi:hypothetical protein